MNENIKKLIDKNPDLEAYINSLSNENNKLKNEVESLQFTLKSMNRKIFGSSSEKTKNVNKEEDTNLFNFNEAEQHKNLNAVEPKIEQVVKRKKRTSRSENIANLETEKITYELADSKCVCDDCGSTLKIIGTDSRETIKIIKKAIKVLEESTVYSCPRCETIKKSEMPKLPIPGGIASPSLLAQVIVDKTANALPLYRQSEDYKRIGLNLSRQNLSNWMIKSADLLDVVYDHMKKDLMTKDIIHADETTVQVLKESGKKASTKSYMWTYVSSKYDDDIVLYEYQSNRAGANAKEYLKDFTGYLHVDGYKGYNAVENVTIVNCFAHLRRKFNDIYVTLPEELKETSNVATALKYCNDIYNLDKESYKLINKENRELSVKERFEYKQSNVRPLLEEFNTWLNEKSLTAASDTPYGRAIGYAVKQMPQVMNYLKDGRLELDNNRAERAVKPFVIGRKNWLFSNTPNGARSSAILYSIVQTCILNKVNPYKYLEEILGVLANTKINEINLNEIMPYNKTMKDKYQM